MTDLRFIDTHVHWYDEMFQDGEIDSLLEKAVEAGVTRMIQPDIDSSERERMFSIGEARKGMLFQMIGLYPGSVQENWKDEIDAMLSYKDRDIAGIGEIGLDYHYGADTASLQKEALRVQLELASQMDLPVSIHLREATEDFLAILKDCAHLHLRGSMHAFSLSSEVFQRIMKYGEFYAGIGGVITFKNSRLAQAVGEIPLDRILLETDAPYLTPVPHRGERNESSYIPIIAERVALAKGISIEDVATQTTRNAETLFGL